jgi:putative alpha-1,2-mannosidase
MVSGARQDLHHRRAADQRDILYTGLYHMLLSPNLFIDSDGEYADFSGKPRQLKQGEEQYTNFSYWNTVRSMGEHPNMQWGAGAQDAPPSFDVPPKEDR